MDLPPVDIIGRIYVLLDGDAVFSGAVPRMPQEFGEEEIFKGRLYLFDVNALRVFPVRS